MQPTLSPRPGPAPRQFTRACRECQTVFDLPPFAVAAQYVFVCPECSERHAVEDDKRAIQDSRDRIINRWSQFCPRGFLDTEPHKLPSPTKLQKALEWKMDSDKNLLLHGATGKGKSRVMWQVFKREFLNGARIKVIDSQITYDLCAAFDSKGGADRWISSLNQVELLGMDDVFKAKLSEGVEQAIFSVIDSRIQNRKPMILTLNDTGATLLARLSVDRGAPLIRRLKESFVSIAFL